MIMRLLGLLLLGTLMKGELLHDPGFPVKIDAQPFGDASEDWVTRSSFPSTVLNVSVLIPSYLNVTESSVR